MTRSRLFVAALVLLGFTVAILWQTPRPSLEPCHAAERQRPPAERNGQKHTNHLIHETSPYLLQHAHNPVNWYPWGEEALALARQQNKPIFLSVGYSTCYWCHVMERESFENDEVAQVLNDHFVAIKVDREERPDIDEQYMLATQLMTGRGGWPNSVWLTPAGKPWMAGTYFPRDQFITLLKRLAQLWREEPELVAKQADALAEAIARASGGEQKFDDDHELTRVLVEDALVSTKPAFDRRHGGFGGAPKFPPHGVLRLLAYEIRDGQDGELKNMLTRTLDAMWRGGIHDHIGGGFHRYATDERWFLPHFEKMLYDNAQLMRAYTDAYVLTGLEHYRQAVADIFAWLQRDMTHPEGAFYSALDSESEGEEGKFYVWSYEELVKLLGKSDAKLFADVYGFQPEGNFTEEATGHRPGTNIPYLPEPLDEVARKKGLDPDKLALNLAAMRQKLLAARNQRAFPHRDDKILAAWNGLMISALAHAGDQLAEPSYTDAAARAADFVLDRMMKEGTLLRTWRAGQARLPGYLDDYAFLAEGLLELYEATGDDRWLQQAKNLAEAMLAKFQDEGNGGFYFTSDEHPDLIVRSKNLLGGGNIPSGNGVAAQILLRLGRIIGEERYLAAARRTLRSLSGFMAGSPRGAEGLILAAAMLLDQQDAESDRAVVDRSGVTENYDGLYEIGPVTARLYASQLTVRPGQTFQAAVRLDIDDRWHLYGPNPGAAFLIPTTLSVESTDTIAPGQIEIPAGQIKADPVLGQSVKTYEGEIWFRVPLTVAKTATAGKKQVTLELRTQACDENRCLPPRTTTLDLPILVNSDAPDGVRHPTIFAESR